MCSKFRTVSAIFTDVWCIQEPQVAKCWYGNIEQRKWCRTTEIWRIGVNENVRQFFGQCEVNPRQSWMIWISRCGSRIPSTGFWIPCFRIPADFLSWTPRIPDSTSKDLPVSGIWIPYVIPYTERNTLTYMGRSCFPCLPYVHFYVINTLIAFM